MFLSIRRLHMRDTDVERMNSKCFRTISTIFVVFFCFSEVLSSVVVGTVARRKRDKYDGSWRERAFCIVAHLNRLDHTAKSV